jgi:uncharacterized protein YjbJ (UPF0337 family)
MTRHLEDTVDNNRIDNMGNEGVGHEVKGTIKEQVGQVTGNRSQQVEGNVEKNVGKAEQMIDAMTDRMRGNTDKS